MKNSKYTNYFKKRIVILVLLLVIVCASFGVSYSNFIYSDDENHRAVEMLMGGIKYNMSINDTNTTSYTLSSGINMLNINVVSTSTNEFYYKICNTISENYDVILISGSPLGILDNAESVALSLIVINKTDENQIISFKLNSGYVTNTVDDIIIDAGYSEILSTNNIDNYAIDSENISYLNLNYILKSDNTLEITSLINPSTVLVIPSKIDNINVTSIGDGAFNTQSTLQDVIIPNSITSISKTAFINTQYYSTISSSAVNNLIVINGLLVDGSNSIGNVLIPSNVNRINSRAFENNTFITSVTFPEGLTNIDEYAFNGCTNLSVVNTSTTVEDIKEYAFNQTAFLVNNTSEYLVLNNVLISAKNVLGIANIPSGVKKINVDSFNGNTQTTIINIPSSVQVIDSNAFSLISSRITTINIDNEEGIILNSPWGATLATINYTN